MLKEPLTIPKISAITKEAFYKEYVYKNKPVVITGLVDGWSALKIWNVDYFKSKYGTSKVQAYQLNIKGECDIDTNKGSATQEANLGECLSTFDFPELQTRWSVAASKDLFPAEINKEFKPPIYCAEGKFLRSMVFIGPTGVVSPLHQDLPENLYVMVNGVKRITLFKPSDSVYPNSRLSNLPNHSQIDAEQPNFEKFPKLINAQPYVVDLKAGETLFIPSFWWHHLRNLEPSFAVNFWWSQGWKLPIAWAASLYKKWRAI
jgi:hypothetical protein